MTTLDATSDFARVNGDLSKDLRIVRGVDALVQRLENRLLTRHGSWPVDRDFGYAIAEELNDSHKGDLSRIARRVEAEFLKDEQVKSVTTSFEIDASGEAITLTTVGFSAVGPFRFTRSISELTPSILAAQNTLDF